MDVFSRQAVERAKNLLDGALPKVSREVEAKSSGAFLDLSRRDLEKFSLLQAIGAKYERIMRHAGGLGNPQFVGVEAECHHELVKRFGEPEHQGTIYIPADFLYRDLQASSGASGGFLVATKNMSFIDRLRNRSIAYRLGGQPMPGQRDNITVPKGSGGTTTIWLSNETSQATESTQSFVQVAASPKTCAAYCEISRQLLKQGGPAGEAIVTGVVADDLAVTTDAAVVSGSGASGEPQGILNTLGIGTASGASLGYAGVVAPQKTVADANAVLNPETLGYVTTPTIAEVLKNRQRFTGSDSPLWRGAVHEGEIEGVRAVSTKQIPSSTLLFGDWSSVIIPEWGVLAVEVNPFANFKAGIVGVRALWSIDVIVQHPSCFVAVTGVS